MSDETSAGDRRARRIPVALEIEYRSAGAFLVAYSTNLSKGGLFIETGDPLPVGTTLDLRLRAPDATAMDLEGVVAWVRKEATDDGLQTGMGIQLQTPETRYGAVVDRIVTRFTGIQILVGAGEPAPRAILHRYLRSILACEIVETDGSAPGDAPSGRIDLAVIDVDSLGARSDEVVRRALDTPGGAVPVIALAQKEHDRKRVGALGASAVITSPPVFGDLQAAVIRTLARPSAVR